MKTFRILVGILAVLPLAMLTDSIFLHPAFYGAGSPGELLFPIAGLPILTLNFWAWMEPEVVEFYFLGKISNGKDC